jgi:hypothetical protein
MEPAEIYIDESGSSGADLRNPDQPNLLLAAVSIPASSESAFWSDAMEAWNLAADMLGQPVASIELKASELFGGKGTFRGTDGCSRRKILSILFHALIEHGAIVFWDGFSKASLADALEEERTRLSAKRLSDRVIKVFCDNLHHAIQTLQPDGPMFVMADELPTKPCGQALMCDSWSNFEENAVRFGNSTEVHGLQVADIVAHTLARANRASLPASDPPSLSNTDQLAVQFRQELAGAGRWINLSQNALAE